MAKKPDKAFGSRLQMLINESSFADMTQAEIAKRFKVSPPMVTHYKDGVKLPSMETAIRMAHQLECCVEFLLTGRGPKHPGVPDEDGDGTHLDISLLPPGQQVHLRALVHSIQEQGPGYKKKVNHDG